jgi:hypothetical protein
LTDSFEIVLISLRMGSGEDIDDEAGDRAGMA